MHASSSCSVPNRRARSRWLTTIALATAAVLASGAPVAHAAAPLTGTGTPGVISGRYIVVMKGTASQVAKERTKDRARARGGRVDRDYNRALKGYAAALPPAALEKVRNDPDVAYVEADAVMTGATTQTSATWGLDRIDQRDLPLSGTYTYAPTGAGVKAYIIDSGIRYSHSQFGGRASSGYDAVDGGSADDCHGHGTHVAGTLGATTHGVAKGVSLVGVRVLDCSNKGPISGIIAGIDWVTSDHAAGQPAVANMSLGGGASSALDAAVESSIADGVTYAVLAGNGTYNDGIAVDACTMSPARVAGALTVGATTSTDARASFSNYGSCLDVFAPGSSITSSWNTSDTATNTISGTSMATPHVAGVAALYLQGAPTASPAAVMSAVTSRATPGQLTNPGTGSPNRLLFSQLQAPASAPDRMRDDARLYASDYLDSADRRYRLYMQSDGNLVLYYAPTSHAIWATNTSGTGASYLRMQSDGNLVIYDATNQPTWATNTDGHLHALLVVQNDGNLVIYDANWTPIWWTGTSGRT